MPRTLVLLAAALAVLSPAGSLLAQKFVPKTIQFIGVPEYSDQELLDAAGLSKGQALATAEMNTCAQKLIASGVFESAGYKFDGTNLVFTLTPDPTLLPVRLGNLPFTRGPELDARIHKRQPLYHGKVPSEGSLLDGVRQAFEALLAADGIKATVAAAPYAGPNDGNRPSAITFTIASPAVRLGTVRMEGASMALLPRLRGLLDSAADPLFDAQNTVASLEEKFTSFYLDQGFAAVKVHAARSGALKITPDGVLVPFLVSIQEGRLYRIGAIHLPPNALVTQAEADKIVNSPDRHTMGQALPSVLSLIQSRYRAKGYLDLAATPQPAFNNAAGTVDYTVDIEPGTVYRVAYVKFDNVSEEQRSHLMRQFQLMPGDPLDQGYLDAFLAKAESQDPLLRRSLAGAPSTIETTPDPTTHDVNVVIRVEKP
jgi:outer membrane protein assembly factor BamA